MCFCNLFSFTVNNSHKSQEVTIRLSILKLWNYLHHTYYCLNISVRNSVKEFKIKIKIKEYEYLGIMLLIVFLGNTFLFLIRLRFFRTRLTCSVRLCEFSPSIAITESGKSRLIRLSMFPTRNAQKRGYRIRRRY